MLKKNRSLYLCFLVSCFLWFPASLLAEVYLPSLFGDHMVLQRDQVNPIWGKAGAGEAINVMIGEQRHSTKADSSGNWRVNLQPLSAGGPYHLKVQGTNTILFEDVLIGEVWLCSGQSNMRWSVESSAHAEVEIASANHPELRLITVPIISAREPKYDFEARWEKCSPETVAGFSAVGYFFGRRLHTTLEVPVGLINNAWGGSAAEAWVSPKTLREAGGYEQLLRNWRKKVAEYSDEKHAQRLAAYEAWKAGGRKGERMRYPRDPRYWNHRPGNAYFGMLSPVLGYGMRGAIWYQGESNASRAEQYKDLFPLLIRSWRKEWGQGAFPFYWVQLADFGNEREGPVADSDWAELREAQTMTLSLPNTGQAVVIDTGEGRDIHPRDKQTVANRLVRHALVNEHGYSMAAQSPRVDSVRFADGIATVTFDFIDEGLYAFDTRQVRGFTLAGEDGQFFEAGARIADVDTVEVFSEEVATPKAVRYGWADNPVVNLYDRNGLPVTPFRRER
jgi:sialate O-acetylesterase